MKPLIFISSVSRELKTARQLVANTLHALGYEPVWQDIFETSPDDLREMLRKKIDSCSAVLQIVGHSYGAEPPTPDATFGRCSYTQYEAFYARSRKKPVYYLIAENDLPRDAAAETIDTPRDESDTAKADADERQRLQSIYCQDVLTAEQVYYPVHNHQETELSVRRLRDDLAKLRRGFKYWMVGITAALVLIAAGIAWLNRGQEKQVEKIAEAAKAQQELTKSVEVAQQKTSEQIAATGQKTQEQMQEVVSAVKELTNPVVLAERIRKEIYATAEEKIKALPDEKGRGRLIAEIEKERDLALGRVDDLIKLIQEGLKEGASPVFQRAAEILQKEGTNEALVYLESRRPSTLETARRHADQAKTAQARADAEKELRNKSLQALVLEADLLESKLEWKRAEELREQVAGLAPDWFEARNQVGILNLRLAHFRKSEPHLRATLELAANLGQEARAFNNLAQLLIDTNRLAEAEQLLRRSLSIEEQSHGPNHPNVANPLNNLANLYFSKSDMELAEPMMRRALAIIEQSYGAKHPKFGTVLNNFSQLLESTNRLAEAEQLLRRSLSVEELSHGPNHPEVAKRLGNLAALYFVKREMELAEPLMHRALAIMEQSYGAAHPMVSIELNNLAQLLSNTKRLADAELLMHRALAIDEQYYGADHPSVARCLGNLGGLLKETKKRRVETEPLLRHALAINEKSYGADHPSVAINLEALANLLMNTKRLAQAEQLYRRCVEIKVRFAHRTGHEHINPVIRNVETDYRIVLTLLKLPSATIYERMHTARTTLGELTPIVPEVETLLGPSKPLEDVLAALELKFSAIDKPRAHSLPLDQPIAPHLSELLRPDLDTLGAEGDAAHRNSDPANAILRYEEVLNLLANAPNHVPDRIERTLATRINRAAALQEIGEVKQARDELVTIIQDMDNSGLGQSIAKERVHYLLALSEWQFGDRDAAQRNAEESLRVLKYLKPAHRYRAKTKRTEQLLTDLKENKAAPPLAKGDAVAALEHGRARFRARAELATLPLNQSILPLLDQLLGPAKPTQEVFEKLDRRYREQNKPPVWFLPLSEPISPHLDELLGPMNDPIPVATGDWETLLKTNPVRLAGLLVIRSTHFAKVGQVTEVAQTGAKLRELEPKTGGNLYNAACAYSLCAGLVIKDQLAPTDAESTERKSFIELSLACLKEAITAGYSDYEHIRKDTDLNTLHGLPEFEALFPKEEAK